MYESLHNHTTASDGTQDYLEVLETAERYRYGVMAFTDHDTLPDEATIKRLRDYQGNVKWLIGCEISSGLPKELGGGPTSSIHILGLFTDPTNAALRQHCDKALKARTERMQRIVANLQSLNFVISVDDCLQASGGESVGRPHIVRALNAHPENAAVIEGLRQQMEQAAKTSPQVAMDYMHMMEQPPREYPFRLFLSDDAFIPDIYVDYLYSVDFDAAVKLIRDAGGIAILAHWYTAERSINAQMLEDMLRTGRLDGVEIMGNPLNNAAQRAQPRLLRLAEQTKVAITYGADAHYDRDLGTIVGNLELAKATVGQTQTLIERFKPNLTFSNLS